MCLRSAALAFVALAVGCGGEQLPPTVPVDLVLVNRMTTRQEVFLSASVGEDGLPAATRAHRVHLGARQTLLIPQALAGRVGATLRTAIVGGRGTTEASTTISEEGATCTAVLTPEPGAAPRQEVTCEAGATGDIH